MNYLYALDIDSILPEKENIRIYGDIGTIDVLLNLQIFFKSGKRVLQLFYNAVTVWGYM